MGTALGIAALVVAIVSALLAYLAWRAADRSADAADRSASAAESADRREREPELSIVLDHPSPAPVDRVIYRLRNDGPQDLTSIVIERPRPPDQIIYNLAVTGQDWADDEIVFAAVAVTDEVRFTFSRDGPWWGRARRMRIGVCRSGQTSCRYGARSPFLA